MKIALEFDVPDWFMDPYPNSEESLMKREILVSLFEVDSLFGFEDSDGSLQDFLSKLIDSESLEDVVFGLTKMEHCKNVVERCYERLKKIKVAERDHPVIASFAYPYSTKTVVSELITDLRIQVVSHQHFGETESVTLKFPSEAVRDNFNMAMNEITTFAKPQTL